MTTERYNHHGVMVAVSPDLKGKHQQHCLCFDACAYFKPGQPENCNIAQAVYGNCVKFNIATPMWECPRYSRAE